MSATFLNPIATRARDIAMLAFAGCLLGLSLLGCSRAPAVDGAPVEVGIRIDHTFGGKAFALGTAYDGPHGRSGLRVTRLNYYLGQFRLQHEDGRWFSSRADAASPGDYRLVDAAQPQSLTFAAIHVPPGRYKTIEFLLGVDEARDRGGAQSGALDPAGGMFWTWKTGFIFLAIEGRSPASGAKDGALTFHVGGDARLSRTLVLPFAPEALVVEAGGHPVVRLRADLGRFFDGLSLADTHTVTTPAGADALADRYAQVITVERVERGARAL